MTATPEQLDYSSLPVHLRHGFKDYIEHRMPPGGFIRACLENDFIGAVGKADQTSVLFLKEIAAFLYMQAPQACWGSPERVKAWLEGGDHGAG